MHDARASGSADGNRVSRQVGVGDGGKNTILLMAHVDELDLAVAAQAVDDRIEGVAHNAVTAFDAGIRKHFPQKVGNFSRHGIPPSVQLPMRPSSRQKLRPTAGESVESSGLLM